MSEGDSNSAAPDSVAAKAAAAKRDEDAAAKDAANSAAQLLAAVASATSNEKQNANADDVTRAKQGAAATKLESMVRGRQGRREGEIRRQQHREKATAATTLESAFRVHAAKQKVEAMRNGNETQQAHTNGANNVVDSLTDDDEEDINDIDREIWRASDAGDMERLEVLLEDPDRRCNPHFLLDKISGTALHAAAARGNKEVYDMLVDHGWDPNARAMPVSAEQMMEKKEQGCECVIG
jgi:hypothetical protein